MVAMAREIERSFEEKDLGFIARTVEIVKKGK